MLSIRKSPKVNNLIIFILSALLFSLFLSTYGKNLLSINPGSVYLIKTTLAISFLGGVMAFLSPCLGFIAPISTYFALSKNKIFDYSFFYLGFIVFFIPITFAGSILSLFLMPYYQYFFYIAALILFLAAIVEIFRKSCKINTIQTNPNQKYTPFVLGVSYSLTSIACTGPILGAITTLTFAKGVFLLYPFLLSLAFAFGMMMPLLAISHIPVFRNIIKKSESSFFDMKILRWRKSFSWLKTFRVLSLLLSGVLIIFFGGFENNVYETITKKVFLLPGYYSFVIYGAILLLFVVIYLQKKLSKR